MGFLGMGFGDLYYCVLGLGLQVLGLGKFWLVGICDGFTKITNYESKRIIPKFANDHSSLMKVEDGSLSMSKFTFISFIHFYVSMS